MGEDIANEDNIKSKIYTIRGLQVMLDSDLAELYQVTTKALNHAVKRNIERFPEHYMFQISDYEVIKLRSQFVTAIMQTKGLKGGRTSLPYVFTEQGVSMLSAVLHSDIAIKVSIRIMDSFIEMRHHLADNALIYKQLDRIELKQIQTDNTQSGKTIAVLSNPTTSKIKELSSLKGILANANPKEIENARWLELSKKCSL